MIDSRWEHGSEFHWLDEPPATADADREWLASHAQVAHASGRGALRALLEHGHWPRVWLPSYVCAELFEVVGDRTQFYACDPTYPNDPADARAGDVVLRINHFGLRRWQSAAELRSRGITVIDDHTHDPCGDWARHSDADYNLASLRKSLPLPDGALLWSSERPLPAQPPPSDEAAAKLPAMLLKRLYLCGHAVDKAVYRELALAGEARLAALGSAGMSRISTQLLASLAITHHRAQRRANFAAFVDALAGRVEVLAPEPGTTPFACVVRLGDRCQRDAVRAQLIDGAIYPALLWDLDPIPGHRKRFPASCELGDRLLAIHCDGRYAPKHMRRVAAAVLCAV